MYLHNFRNGITDHNHNIRCVINYEGVYVMREDGYAYTIGLKIIGLPDLLLIGEHQTLIQLAGSLINVFNESPDFDITEYLALSGFSFKVNTNQQTRSIAYASRAYYGDWDFDLLTITKSDPCVS